MTDTKKQIQEMVDDGKSLAAIGEELGGITRQAISQKLKPQKRDWKNKNWKNYKRHEYHKKVGKIFIACESCQSEQGTMEHVSIAQHGKIVIGKEYKKNESN